MFIVKRTLLATSGLTRCKIILGLAIQKDVFFTHVNRHYVVLIVKPSVYHGFVHFVTVLPLWYKSGLCQNAIYVPL